MTGGWWKCRRTGVRGGQTRPSGYEKVWEDKWATFNDDAK